MTSPPRKVKRYFHSDEKRSHRSHLEDADDSLPYKKQDDEKDYKTRSRYNNRNYVHNEQNDCVDVEEDVKPEKLEDSSENIVKQKKTAKEYHKDAKLKQYRLIVRNLPFKATKEDLQNVCSNFGSFTEIIVPPSTKMPGKCAGFAFIQFKSRNSATQAKDYLNSNKIMGRTIAADWALDRDTYETKSFEEKSLVKAKVKEEKDDGEGYLAANLKAKEENNKKGNIIRDKQNSSEKVKLDTAVEDGRAVFLRYDIFKHTLDPRNLAFETDEETLKNEASKFGKVELAIICKFKDSGHSKGTAFVHFSSKDEANEFILAGEKGDFIIDGRTISVILAIPREKAAEIEKEANKKLPSDNRNLRLLRLSFIREETSAAAGMSSEDAAKRVRLTEVTRKKLENLHMFVSPIRLVIHNVPPKITDMKLREICKNAGGEGAFITECRIWKDPERLDAKGEPKSKGFAFVAFKEHAHALACLQKLNNNSSTFTNEKRPIVEFSIENLTALQKKERRLQQSKGELTNVKQLNEKVRKQVQESIGKVHMAGMKFLPKLLGKKMRHRNLSKNKKKKLGLIKKDKKSPSSSEPQKKKKSSKKSLTKYLALSS